MKFSLLFKSFGILLLSLPCSVRAASCIESEATMLFDPGSELHIFKGHTLENSGNLIIKGNAKIGCEGCIKNESIIQLSKITSDDNTKDLILSGEGSIQVEHPQENAIISLIQTQDEAKQILSGTTSGTKSKIKKLEINESTILTKDKTLSLDIENSSTQGELIIDGSIIF
ncbi:MAG: hypothetical protein Q4E61_01925 [Alphaproteobacteria bacterium]|nr:hypothetical protein [Alphaproteobacteria bacterium]